MAACARQADPDALESGIRGGQEGNDSAALNAQGAREPGSSDVEGGRDGDQTDETVTPRADVGAAIEGTPGAPGRAEGEGTAGSPAGGAELGGMDSDSDTEPGSGPSNDEGPTVGPEADPDDVEADAPAEMDPDMASMDPEEKVDPETTAPEEPVQELEPPAPMEEADTAPAALVDRVSPVTLPFTVQFNRPPGAYAEPISLSLSVEDPQADIHYTLDGSLPTSRSPLATGPIAIDRNVMVRAFAVRDGGRSQFTNAAYFRLAADVRDFTSDLPILIVDMQGGEEPDPNVREYVESTFGVFEPQNGTTVLNGAASATSRLGIKIRGRSTRYAAKHNYTVELWGVEKEDAPLPLLGLPEDGDWVLYAPFETDPSLLHNPVGYAVSRSIGRYAPRTRYCEMFLAAPGQTVSKADYVGLYVLTERIQRGSERVPVEKLDDDDNSEPALTGGYIVQTNQPDPNDISFSAGDLRFLYVYPNDDDVTSQQTQYIRQYIDAAMAAARAADGRDPATGLHYEDLLDVPSFIDHHILGMLYKNPDAFTLSTYFHKARNGRFAAGPLWDLDLAMGARDPWGNRSLDPTGWLPSTTAASKFEVSFWGPLFQHADFESEYWSRFRELLAGPLRSGEINAIIDGFAAEIRQAELRNRERWPSSAPRDDSYAAEVEALRVWFARRLNWIEDNLGTLP